MVIDLASLSTKAQSILRALGELRPTVYGVKVQESTKME